MSFGVAGRELDRGASLVDRAIEVLPGSERAGKIGMRVGEVRLQLDCQRELRDGFVFITITVAARHQHPAQRVVSLGRVRRQADDFFEDCARGGQVALLQLAKSLLVEGVYLGVGGRFLRVRGQDDRDEEKRDQKNSDSNRRRNQEDTRDFTENASEILLC